MESILYPGKFSSVLELTTYFKDETTACKWLANRRWGNNIACVHCGSCDYYAYSDNRRYKCKECKKQFTVKIGTVFEDSKVPLHKWFIAFFSNVARKKGISSHQLARDIGVTQKTAWFMLARIRWALNQGSFEGKLCGTIESDETFVGGKNKNRHACKKVKGGQGRGSFKDKTAVLGLVQRDGPVRAFVLPDTKTDTIHPLLLEHVQVGSTLISDEFSAYAEMCNHFIHEQIDHTKYEYVRGKVTTNRIEGYWSHLKRTIIGTYHHITPQHLQRYVDESVFRYNTRNVSDSERMVQGIDRCEGKRLTYKQLIGKV